LTFSLDWDLDFVYLDLEGTILLSLYVAIRLSMVVGPFVNKFGLNTLLPIENKPEAPLCPNLSANYLFLIPGDTVLLKL
jgi:hypothetical protein